MKEPIFNKYLLIVPYMQGLSKHWQSRTVSSILRHYCRQIHMLVHPKTVISKGLRTRLVSLKLKIFDLCVESFCESSEIPVVLPDTHTGYMNI